MNEDDKKRVSVNLTKDELLIINNCVGWCVEFMETDGEFHAKIGAMRVEGDALMNKVSGVLTDDFNLQIKMHDSQGRLVKVSEDGTEIIPAE